MTEPEIYAALTALYRDVLGNDEIILRAETNANDIEGWDSFNHLVLMVAVEKRFAIKLSTAEAENLKDVGDLIRIIAARTAL